MNAVDILKYGQQTVPQASVKANLLLTHFANFKWTHPYADERKKALFVLCGELPTTLMC